MVATVAIVAFAYDRMHFTYWIGSKDLEIIFVVTDAETGRAIPDASIDIMSDGESSKDARSDGEFTLKTDSTGTARTVRLEIPCCGEQSGLRLTDTVSPYLPLWSFRTTSPGYVPSDRSNLNTPDHIQRTKKVDSRHAKLVVSIPLRRLQ